MKIGVDIRCLAEGRRTGVEEYTINLLKNVFELDKQNRYILFLNSWKKPAADLAWIGKYPNVEIKRTRWPNKLLNFIFWYANRPKIDQLIGQVDVFFFPNIIFGNISQKIKSIATFHDLSFERLPETFSLIRRFWHIFINPQKIAKKADKIIAVSHSTKSDLNLLYGINLDKISVIWNGISKKFKPIDRNNPRLLEIKQKYNLPFKFILFLGTIEPRKNIIGLIRSFDYLQSRAKKENRDELLKYKLVIAGYAGWKNREIFSEIKKSDNKNNIIFAGCIPDEDKEYLLNLASIFVYPSFFEGFGIPVLEAMACGTPTITSNTSSLPEIAGRGAILVDPDKPEEIFEAMREILISREFQNHLSREGIAQAKKFNWQKSAREFLELIHRLPSHKNMARHDLQRTKMRAKKTTL